MGAHKPMNDTSWRFKKKQKSPFLSSLNTLTNTSKSAGLNCFIKILTITKYTRHVRQIVELYNILNCKM